MTFPRRNRLVGAGLAVVVAGMVGLSFASVPLYRLFCAVTGYAGTPNITDAAAPGASAKTITVSFNADVNAGLPWSFAPERKSVTLPLGEQQVAFYEARNQAPTPVTGIAVYNVTPEKVGKYFHKTACFCFNEQTLAPGQDMQFPLSFWVDPAIAADPDTADVRTITLSYTFYRSLDDAAKTGALAKAGPHVGQRAERQPADQGDSRRLRDKAAASPAPSSTTEAGSGTSVNSPLASRDPWDVIELNTDPLNGPPP